jgi:hypothetical protein
MHRDPALLLLSYAATLGIVPFEASHLTSVAYSRSVRIAGKPDLKGYVRLARDPPGTART